MRGPTPDDFDDDAVPDALVAGWGFVATAVQYLQVGGGGYHWHAVDGAGESLFVTLDDLDSKDWFGHDRDVVAAGLLSALQTATLVRDEAQLDFVVAPHPTKDGRPLVRLSERYTVSVYSQLVGQTYQFGHSGEPALRDALVDALIGLHSATPPACTPRHVQPHIGGRPDLEAFLARPSDHWVEGAFGEQARAVFLPHADDLSARLECFDGASSCIPDRVVVTHGEPHPGNLMTVGDDLKLIDWDTVGLAAPERDLWLVGLDAAATRRYTAATGHRPDESTLALYRERWHLDDIAQSVRMFRGPHRDDADTQRWLRALPDLLASAPA